MRRALAVVIVAAIALLFLVVAIPDSTPALWLAKFVSGGRGIALHETATTAAAVPSGGTTLRGGIGAMISPQRTISEYDHLFRLVAKKLEMPPEIVQRRKYAEVNELLERGELDFAWVCTGAVDELEARGVAVPLVAPVVGGTTQYRAYLIVRADSGISGFAELRGRRFAFTDPLSLTGRNVAIEQLRTLGETPDSYFSESFFTYAHDNSVRAVQRGLADGATVDSLVFDLLAKQYPDEVSRVRVVWKSQWFPIPPIVVSRRESPELVARLRDAFTSLHDDPEGRAILDAVGIERFVPVEPGAYAAR
ncbi:MAG: PhnD/SsuA/transferrin family substrate-binding protein [Acidobacteria bacterium]|nr:PhnD/SsuA/transferrin family substrate-binding protein [Acidobacteriota bacterium]